MVKAAKACQAGPITLFDASGFSTRIAAEVKGFDAAAVIKDHKSLKYASRAHQFALAAADQAMADSGIAPSDEDGDRWGCVVGAGMMTVAHSEIDEVQKMAAPGGELQAERLLETPVAQDCLLYTSPSPRD